MLSVALSLSFARPRRSVTGGGDLGRWALPTTASCGARTFLSPLVAQGAEASRQLPGSDRPASLQTMSSLYPKEAIAGWQNNLHFRH